MPRRFVLLSIALASACTGSTISSSHEPLTAGARREGRAGAHVEIVRTLSSPPEGGDGPSLVELSITSADGDHTFGPVVGGVAWEDGALILHADRRLSLGRANGEELAIDTDVTFVPVVAPDGQHYVYARSEDGTSFSLVSRSTSSRATLAHGLASIGAVRFIDADAAGRFVFVAGRPGGVAGLFLARTSSSELAVCLTNCALRTGQPWGDAFVPLPADLESLSLDGDVLTYADESGGLRGISTTGAGR